MDIQEAFKIAAHYHIEQMYGNLPYTKHLNDVYQNALKFNITDRDVLLACILHDTLEDTKITPEEIDYIFGPQVLDVVKRVTNEPGQNRKERLEKTYPKIKGHRKATLVKLCDRIANVENSKRDNQVLFEMYKKEYPNFKSSIKVDGIADELWLYLDKLF